MHASNSLQVGSLVMGPEFNKHFEELFVVLMRQLVQIVPPGVNIPEAYEKGTDDQQKFVQNLALFFTGYFKVGGACVHSSVLALHLSSPLICNVCRTGYFCHAWPGRPTSGQFGVLSECICICCVGAHWRA